MLDELAYRIVFDHEWLVGLIGIGLFSLGLTIGVFVSADKTSGVQRAPYFAFTAFVFLTITSVTCVWYFSPEAIVAGVLWVLVTFVSLSLLGLGYLNGLVAAMRARDAFANSYIGLIAIIPIVSLALFLKRSKNHDTIKQTGMHRLFRDGWGVLFGLLILCVALPIRVYLVTLMPKQISARVLNDDKIAYAFVDLTARAQGIEKALTSLTSHSTVPLTTNESTTLRSVHVDGNHLIQTYVIADAAAARGQEVINSKEYSLCTSPTLLALLHNGLVIEERYVGIDGAVIDLRTVTSSTCNQTH